MKRILPKGKSVSQVGEIFPLSQTPIILAITPQPSGAAPPHGGFLSSPLILPAPPTSTITVASQKVLQPTPVMLPLTKNASSSSSTAHLQCFIRAPKNFSSGVGVRDQLSNTNYFSLKSSKGQSLNITKKKRNSEKIQSKKYSGIPIFPKDEGDSQTVILVPSSVQKGAVLSSSVTPSKCSVMINNDRQMHSTNKERKKVKKKERMKKNSKVKLLQGNEKVVCKHTLTHKYLKKRYIEKPNNAVTHETNKTEHLNIDPDNVKEDSFLCIGESSMCSPESLILPSEGSLNQSSQSSTHQGVPHHLDHPPPPYPQDLVDTITSHSETTTTKPLPIIKFCQDKSQLITRSQFKRKKNEGKSKTYNLASEKLYVSNKVTDVSYSHSSISSSQVSTASNSSSLLFDITLGKTSTTDTKTVASSCSYSFHSYYLPNNIKNIHSSSNKFHANIAGPPHDIHTSLSVFFQPQALTPTKSTQKKSFEESYPFSSSFDGVSSGSSLQPLSHSTNYLQTPVVTHSSQCANSSSSITAHDELKLLTTIAPSQGSLQCTMNTQCPQNSSSSHSHVIRDQAPNSALDLPSAHCDKSLHSVSQINSFVSTTESNSAITGSFPMCIPSQDQIYTHKAASHSSSCPEFSQMTSDGDALHSTHMSLPLNNSEVSQIKLITKYPHTSQLYSHQLPSSTQSTEVAVNNASISQGHSSPTSYIGVTHPHPCLKNEHLSYPPSARPLSLDEGHQDKIISDYHFSQGISFSPEYAASYASPESESHSRPPHTPMSVENLSMTMFKDNTQSPALTLDSSPHVSSLTQSHINSPSQPYVSEQTYSHDTYYYITSKFKASSSVDPTSSQLILGKTPNPPSYEAHIQHTAPQFGRETSCQVTPDHSHQDHHQTSPANYSLSCHLVRDHEDSQIDHSIITDITQGSYDYNIEGSSQTNFPSSTDAHLVLPAVTQSPNLVQYNGSHGFTENLSTNTHIASHSVQNTNVQLRSQSRVFTYPLTRQESLYKNSDDVSVSTWSNATRSSVNSDDLRLDKLLFIPQSEQTPFLSKKDLSKNISSDPALQLSKDVMLKKFWIEEDEPLAEEIVSSLPGRLPPPQTLPKTNNSRLMLCQICGKMLKGRNSLRCHLNSHHNIQPHSCSTCGKSFSSSSTLVEHLRIHSGDKPFLCIICDTAFRTRSGLLRHGSLHTSARPHECSICSKKFKTNLVLQQHLKLHLTNTFTCAECGKTFKSHKAMAVHKAFHHHKTLRFKCLHCPKAYHFQSLLKQHMQLHSNVHKYTCSVCGKFFVWRSGLAAHMKTHSASRPKCNICNVKFASEKRLKSHYQRHCNSRPHQCKVCGKCFSHAYRMASHALVHQEHKQYVCVKCDIVFTNVKKFRKHLLTHKKEESNNCSLSSTNEVLKPKL